MSAPDVLDVLAVAHQPSGGRFGWLWLVDCPFCSVGAVRSVHAHRCGPHGGIRKAGCGRGSYRLVPVRPE